MRLIIRFQSLLLILILLSVATFVNAHVGHSGHMSNKPPSLAALGIDDAGKPFTKTEFDKHVEKTKAEGVQTNEFRKIWLIGILILILFVYAAFYHGTNPFLSKFQNLLSKIDFYTLGSLTGLIFILILIPTGLIMSLFYMPSIEAYESVKAMALNPILSLLRNLHYWASEIFIVLMLLHVTRVVVTRSYIGKRKWNWILGSILLFLGWFTFLVGTFLKADQEGLEAFEHMVALNMYLPFGQSIIDFFTGVFTTPRLFVMHTIILPIITLFLIPPHIYLNKIYNRVVIRWKTVMKYFTALFAFIFLISIIYPAPLLGEPYSYIEITKPPWPFYWLYGGENLGGMIMMLILPAIFFPLLILFPFIVERLPFNNKFKIADAIFLVGVITLFILSWYVAVTGFQSHIF